MGKKKKRVFTSPAIENGVVQSYRDGKLYISIFMSVKSPKIRPRKTEREQHILQFKSRVLSLFQYTERFSFFCTYLLSVICSQNQKYVCLCLYIYIHKT